MSYKPLTDYSGITPFAKCPSCGQLIKLKSFTDAVIEGARDCPFCHKFIEKKEIISSCETHLRKTRAVQSAEDIFYTHWILLIIFGQILFASAIGYFGGLKYNLIFFIVIFTSVVMLLGGFFSTQGWLTAFSKFQIIDEEFIAAKKKIRHTQIIWAWAIVVYLFWLIIYISFL